MQNIFIGELLALIELQDVAFQHPKQSSPTLNIPHWEVKRLERALIKGPSGSGKSTLLNLLAGLIVPQQGSIHIMGERIDLLNARQRDKFRANNIAYIFQQFNLIPYLSAIENIALGRHFTANKTAAKQADICELLESLNIPEHCWYQSVMSLSIGQQQRIAIARSLLNKPSLLLADEPTSALDARNKTDFLSLLTQLSQDYGTTLIMVSHDDSLRPHFSLEIDIDKLNQKEG